jgi:hypothetical protein
VEEMNKFIHQSTVVYLSLIVLIRMMAMPLSLLDYSINQRFIANNLCENRLNTAMHCGGTCYLNKQLAKANDSQESREQKGTIKILITDFFEPLDKPTFGCLKVEAEYPLQYNIQRNTHPFTGNIFHPPIV